MMKQKNIGQAPSVPHKSTINLVIRENHQTTITTLVIGLAAIALLVFIVAKWGVIDQEKRLQEAESGYNQIHAENEETKAYVARYSEILRAYRSVSNSWMQLGEDTEARVDRQAILDIVEKEMQKKGTVESIQISENVLVVTMSDITLREAAQMLETVEQYPIVSNTSVNSAETVEEEDGEIVSTVSVTVYLTDEEEEGNQ